MPSLQYLVVSFSCEETLKGWPSLSWSLYWHFRDCPTTTPDLEYVLKSGLFLFSNCSWRFLLVSFPRWMEESGSWSSPNLSVGFWGKLYLAYGFINKELASLQRSGFPSRKPRTACSATFSNIPLDVSMGFCSFLYINSTHFLLRYFQIIVYFGYF